MVDALVLGDLQFGNSIDLYALYEVVKIIEKEKPKIIIDVGDVVDYFKIYEWQKTHVYVAQAKIAITWYQWLAKNAETIVAIVGNHDKRPLGDGLFSLVEKKLPENMNYFSKKEAIVNFGERVILVIHGDFFEGSATLRGPSPNFFNSALIYTLNKWKQGYNNINTVVIGHIHSPIGFRRYGERGFGIIDPKDMLDIIVVPSIQSPRTIKFSDRGVILIPEKMDAYPKIVKFRPQLEELQEDGIVIFYAEMLKQYHSGDYNVPAALEEALKYTG